MFSHDSVVQIETNKQNMGQINLLRSSLLLNVLGSECTAVHAWPLWSVSKNVSDNVIAALQWLFVPKHIYALLAVHTFYSTMLDSVLKQVLS